ncbi:major facilitator superfamily domain-containing protein [Pseudomassariella vexata]|uniref:Major facilitator superfamily domain-containing protein n=1 Tax=Pseudomassariella vexata TaxID=1141098 RepID=A0A1Y2DI70_9PEZI|nr:major facilitator superfamily domain-containing protein [Pseudomassariella vexata]ORY58920.1 major facilitator superfamily domain-containing protein [Pseudomassariella vexata]
MPALSRSIIWLYHEFGLSAIHKTGRNAYLIILSRSLRMFAYGSTFILALFFNELGFTDYQIGLFFTLTLLGDVVLGTLLTLIADRVGRRRILLAGSGLMVLSGTVFAYFDNFGILLVASIVGVISATGGDFGPFRSIEESMLSHLTTPETRADVLAWYVATSTLGLAVGSEMSGRIIHTLENKPGWTLTWAYHTLFWIYAVMGVVNAGLMLLLTEACESKQPEAENYSRLQDEEETVESPRAESHIATSNTASTPLRSRAKAGWIGRSLGFFSQPLSQISKPTRLVMYKLWLLLALDSVADGMVPISITQYYINEKFHPFKATLGDAQSGATLLGSISTIFAGPLARKIGLINTMVFTHIPSSAAVLLFSAPSSLWLTIVLLLIRTGLNSMDQAPRAAFIAAVVKPEERTAVMGIASTLRTLAATLGPTVTGILAGNERFWIAFVAAGCCRLVYDAGLYAMFVNMPLHQNEGDVAVVPSAEVADEFALQNLGNEDEDDNIVEISSFHTVEPRPKVERFDSNKPRGSSTLSSGIELAS